MLKPQPTAAAPRLGAEGPVGAAVQPPAVPSTLTLLRAACYGYTPAVRLLWWHPLSSAHSRAQQTFVECVRHDGKGQKEGC